ASIISLGAPGNPTDVTSTNIAQGDTDLTNAAITIAPGGTSVTFDFGTVVSTGDTDNPGAADTRTIVVQVTSRVQDLGSAGDTRTNTGTVDVTDPGTGLPTQPPVSDTETITIVEPNLTLVKSGPSFANPGDQVPYSFVIQNTGSGPAYDLEVADPIASPDLALVSGSVVIRLDGVVISPTVVESAGGFSFTLPTLLPGQTLSVDYDALYGPTVTQPFADNTATVTFDSVPGFDPTNPGRSGDAEDTHTFTLVPTDTPSPVADTGTSGLFDRDLGIDDAQFRPVLEIDPIYSGTAEPGSNVTIELVRQDGREAFSRFILADAGGHWIAVFPEVTVGEHDSEYGELYEGKRLFSAPETRTERALDERPVTIGTDLQSQAYNINLTQERPSSLPQDKGMFNARTYYSTAHFHAPFGTTDVLRVDEVFENTANLTMERLYEATRNPLGDGLNRFNYEFLATQTATVGRGN
ncbi:MAG: hypothetical protein AAGA78_02235, partial [Pseudomonadota bacterium]